MLVVALPIAGQILCTGIYENFGLLFGVVLADKRNCGNDQFTGGVPLVDSPFGHVQRTDLFVGAEEMAFWIGVGAHVRHLSFV